MEQSVAHAQERIVILELENAKLRKALAVLTTACTTNAAVMETIKCTTLRDAAIEIEKEFLNYAESDEAGPFSITERASGGTAARLIS